MQLDDVTNKLVEAMRHALNTDQTPDKWELSPETYVELAHILGPVMFFKAESKDGFIMGLPIVINKSLPPGRFLLKSGHNTVVGHNIYEDPNEPA